MPKAERAELDRQGRRTAVARGLLLLVIVVGSGVCVFSGATFLD